MGKYKSCTITLNRACNLRCWFCYSKDTNFANDKNISDEIFYKIKDFIISSGIRKVTLIGGEPTVFHNVLKYALELKEIGTKITLVTNGILFHSKELCKKYIESGINNYSISIKAQNRIDYEKITGYDSFNKVIIGIKNLLELGARVSVSFVVTEQNVELIKEMVINVKKQTGCKNFFFSFCRNFNVHGHTNKDFINANNPIITARKFEKVVPWLKENVERVVYAVGDPLCIFSKEFIKNNLNDFCHPCYVHTGSILTFDTDGFLIPCNTIHQIKIGKIGIDFNTYCEFLEYQNTSNYKSIYKKLRGIPDLSCLTCSLYKYCQGRCVCNWTNYNFFELKQMIEKFKNSR